MMKQKTFLVFLEIEISFYSEIGHDLGRNTPVYTSSHKSHNSPNCITLCQSIDVDKGIKPFLKLCLFPGAH